MSSENNFRYKHTPLYTPIVYLHCSRANRSGAESKWGCVNFRLERVVLMVAALELLLPK